MEGISYILLVMVLFHFSYSFHVPGSGCARSSAWSVYHYCPIDLLPAGWNGFLLRGHDQKVQTSILESFFQNRRESSFDSFFITQ